MPTPNAGGYTRNLGQDAGFGTGIGKAEGSHLTLPSPPEGAEREPAYPAGQNANC